MPVNLDAQQWETLAGAPDLGEVTTLINALFDHLDITADFSVAVRLIDESESAEFNHNYRAKSGPTNILSFPYEAFPGVESDLLGDLLICAPIVMQESAEQGKTVAMHFCHLVVHGILHLLGYDHETEQTATEMEAIEIAILERQGIANPYVVIDK